MSDNVLIVIVTGSCTALPAIIAILVNNKRFDDINPRIDDNRAVISAEMKAFRVEILAEIQGLSFKIDNAIEKHLLE